MSFLRLISYESGLFKDYTRHEAKPRAGFDFELSFFGLKEMACLLLG
jgi:hypothetical protein